MLGYTRVVMVLPGEDDANSTSTEGLIFIFYYSVCHKAIVDILEIEVTDVLNRTASVSL